MELRVIEVIGVVQLPPPKDQKEAKETEYKIDFYETSHAKLGDGTLVKERRLSNAKTKIAGIPKGIFLVEYREGVYNGSPWRKIDRVFKSISGEAILNEMFSSVKK